MSRMKQYGEDMAELVETLDSGRQNAILEQWAKQLGNTFDITRLLMDGTFWSAVYGPITNNGEQTRLNSNLFKAGLLALRRNNPEDAIEVEQALGMV